MQQQVIIQLGDPTLLKASKSLLPSIQITVGSFGTCLYAENINHTQGNNLSLPPQWVVSMQVVLLVLAVPQPFGLLGVCGQKCHVGWSSSHRFVSDFLLSWTVKFVWEGQDVLLHSVKCQVFRPNHREVQTRPRKLLPNLFYFYILFLSENDMWCLDCLAKVSTTSEWFQPLPSIQGRRWWLKVVLHKSTLHHLGCRFWCPCSTCIPPMAWETGFETAQSLKWNSQRRVLLCLEWFRWMNGIVIWNDDLCSIFS